MPSWGEKLPAPSAAPQAAVPRPTSRPSSCRLLEPWRRWWGRSTALVVLVAMGGGALLSRLREEGWGGAAEVREDGVVATSEGERTAPVSSAYKEGRGGRFGLPLKQPPTISPTMPHSTRAVMGECGGYGTRFWRGPARVCPCPVLGLAQQRSAPCLAQARGLLSVY